MPPDPAPSYDAVVVGAGPNGLVAANHLVDAGWSVLVLEAQPEVGGAVRSARDVHPDFVHDTFSAFYPLAAASPVIRDFELEEHGLAWRHAPAVLGHPMHDGQWAVLHRDREVTAALIDAAAPRGRRRLAGAGRRVGPDRSGPRGGLLTPFPPVRAGLGVLASLPRVGGLRLRQDPAHPGAELGRSRFGGERRGCCSPATPGTPTSRWTRRAPG